MTYSEVCDYIESIPRFTSKNPLDNTKGLVSLLGAGKGNIRWIHVAGTNGKGSVCTCMGAMLTAMGKKTGVFISPHIISMTERIQINGVCISESRFVEAFETVMETSRRWIGMGGSHPTFFEFLFLMSLVVFEQEQVEYAVLETGMGGRLDATNVFENPALCVITSVGMDHMQYLGDTVEKIAWEKAGIIKRNVPVVCADDGGTVLPVIKKKAGDEGAPVYAVSGSVCASARIAENGIAFSYGMGYDEKEEWRVSLRGAYQALNVSLAVKGMEVLFPEGRNPESVFRKQWRSALLSVSLPGRFTQVLPGIFVDGAHNPPAARRFVDTVYEMESFLESSDGGFWILFAVSADKDWKQILRILSKITSHPAYRGVVFTSFSGARSEKPEALQKEWGSDAVIFQETAAAVCFLKKAKNKNRNMRIYCGGSLYLAGELLQLF